MNCIGIDVGKSTLDVCLDGQKEQRRFENNKRGIRALLKWLLTLAVDRVLLEATGGYERPLLVAAFAVGLPIFVANPRQTRCFAKSMGLLEKSDRVDARMLARAAAVLDVRPYQPPSEMQARLGDLVVRRRQLTQMSVMEKQHIEHVRESAIQRSIERTLKALKSEIERIDEQMLKLIDSDPQLKGDSEKLREVKGVGTLTAATLTALLPELGTLTRRAIAKLVGVAPIAKDSGAHRGTRRIQGGRSSVRTALYMATLGAIRFDPNIKATYAKLKDKGKPSKVALIACARKLLVRLNAIMRDHHAQNGGSSMAPEQA